MSRSKRVFAQRHPRRRRAGAAALVCGAVVASLLLLFTPRAAHSNDLSGNPFDSCGTVVLDPLYYCYLCLADIDNKIYAVPGLEAHYPGDRLRVQGTAEEAVSFCTIHGHILDGTISPCDEGCAADLNGDGFVDVFDLLALLGAWGPCGYYDCPADLNGDEVVDVFDLLILLGEWGTCE